MLVSFTLRNWRSFRDEATLSMLATAERRFAWTLPRFSKASPKLLPIAAIYGANASGKTNFFKGLSFFAKFILRGVEEGKPIAVSPYKLNPQKASEPTYFSVTLLTSGTLYKYTLSLTPKSVVYEKLEKLSLKGKNTILFERQEGKDIYLNSSIDEARIRFVYEGTQDNLSFLTAAFKQKVKFVEPIYEWFRSSLIFIGTNSVYGADSIFDNGCQLQTELSNYLSRYDTGISGLRSQPLPDIPHLDSLPQNIIASGRRLRISKNEDGGVKISVLKAMHHDSNGEEVYFDFKEESDGTARLLDLLPVLMLCRAYPKNEKVFIIDEIDRSLHPNLVVKMITEFLERCSSETRFQLIMTTHDTNLMNQKILRRDEMWIINKNYTGSEIYSISDYKNIRFDTILDKLYKEGRFGGVPKVITPILAEKNRS